MFNDLNKFLKSIADSDVVSIVFFNLNVSLVIDRRISEGNVLIKIFPIAFKRSKKFCYYPMVFLY